MLELIYTPSVVKEFIKLETNLKEEVLEKIEFFKNPKNHKQLKVHKLKGPMKNRYSFSVNYKTRVIFEYLSKDEVIFHAVGDHAIYK